MDTPARPEPVDVETLAAKTGSIVGTSRWQVIDQPMIDQFADLISDHQFIHVDPERAKATPYGTTVAHGFLTLSVMGGLAGEVIPRLAGTAMSINYGFDRIRFVAPVRSGRKVRAVVVLKQVEQLDSTAVSMAYEVTLEVEDEQKPAVVAQWLVRAYFGEQGV